MSGMAGPISHGVNVTRRELGSKEFEAVAPPVADDGSCAEEFGPAVEEWRAVPNAQGYEASNLGRVRSARRGRPRIMRATVGPCGFATVTLSALIGGGRCRRVGTLVASAWLGACPDGLEVRRIDGDPLNDRIENLTYGTPDQVIADHAARARREEAAGASTHCPEGHRYADTWLGNWGERDCFECRVKDRAKVRSRKFYVSHRIPKKAAVSPCVDCGANVAQVRRGAPFKRCPGCRVKAAAEYQRRYRAKSRKPQRISYCIDCGVRISNEGPGPLATRCAPHKLLAQREADRRYRSRALVVV